MIWLPYKLAGRQEGSDLNKIGLPKGIKQIDIHAKESLPKNWASGHPIITCNTHQPVCNPAFQGLDLDKKGRRIQPWLINKKNIKN